jgi:hypothetical protein
MGRSKQYNTTEEAKKIQKEQIKVANQKCRDERKKFRESVSQAQKNIIKLLNKHIFEDKSFLDGVLRVLEARVGVKKEEIEVVIEEKKEEGEEEEEADSIKEDIEVEIVEEEKKPEPKTKPKSKAKTATPRTKTSTPRTKKNKKMEEENERRTKDEEVKEMKEIFNSVDES